MNTQIILNVASSIAFITTIISLIPQVILACRTKSTRDVSMATLINYVVGSLAWIVYGSMTETWVVLAANCVGLCTSTILIFQKRYYDARPYLAKIPHPALNPRSDGKPHSAPRNG